MSVVREDKGRRRIRRHPHELSRCS